MALILQAFPLKFLD